MKINIIFITILLFIGTSVGDLTEMHLIDRDGTDFWGKVDIPIMMYSGIVQFDLTNTTYNITTKHNISDIWYWEVLE